MRRVVSNPSRCDAQPPPARLPTPVAGRGAVLLATLGAVCASGCEKSAPASPRDETVRAARSASDWGGARNGHSAPRVATGERATGTWVLHIGDSFVDASFEQNLGPRFRASGAGYVVDATTATYTTTWAFDPEFEQWLSRRPSLVVVTLGANEVEMPVPTEHARAVERIARSIASAGASCVWTTPPMWKADTGILQVIHDHCAPCLFFDSDAVLGALGRDERQPDHIHPNKKGGQRWADAFWGWLEDHRDHARDGWRVVPFELRDP